jgi:hypothetical protein
MEKIKFFLCLIEFDSILMFNDFLVFIVYIREWLPVRERIVYKFDTKCLNYYTEGLAIMSVIT